MMEPTLSTLDVIMPITAHRRSLIQHTLVCGAVFASITIGAQQTAPATHTAPHVAQLAQGWAHLAAGRMEDAIRVGEALLAGGKEPHQAVSFLVTVEVTRGRPIQALDRYEAWQGMQRPDDLFLLAEISLGLARQLASSTDPLVQAEAQSIVDRIDGPPTDRGSSARPASALNDAALARGGDPEAIARLRQRLKAPMGPEAEYVIGALADANDAASIADLRALLAAPQPPVQMAAISALGKLGAKEAIPELRKLAAQRQPLVSTMATVALSRMGDAEAQARVTSLLASPNGEERLMAAEAIGLQESGRWSQAVTAVLEDPSLMLRVQAALLLSRAGVDVEKAQIVLAQALGSENPMLREQAGRAVVERERPEPALLKRFLRDPDGRVQLRGIQGLLAATAR
jgi:HEAT repeat protein